MICVPVSGGQTAAGSTPSAPGGGRRRSSEGGDEGEHRGVKTRVSGGLEGGGTSTRSAQTHLSDQPECPVQAPDVGVLPDFVVQPAELAQSAAGVSQGLAHHHLVGHSAHYTSSCEEREGNDALG